MTESEDTIRAQVFLSQMNIKATPENIQMIIDSFSMIRKENENYKKFKN